MTINAISQANGADLLQLYAQSAGGSAAATPGNASAAALKTAIAEAQLSAAQLVAQTSTVNDTGTQLNVYA
jgi:hypothetical protein